MGDKKQKFVQEITSMEEDFAKWYTDVVKKAELTDYSSVKGCMIIRPYGYAIWENIQKDLDRRFKETGHENVYMPMFIPESLLEKEKNHVEGFAPEVAWVTHGGDEKLFERLCVRPTSEVLFCEHYKTIIQSYRDLPKLYNQWCSVVRWEKTTRPFLRSVEFLWQEGHTMHETKEDALEETKRMLDIYADFCKEVLAIPVLKGEKTTKEKFAGAEKTYTIEAMMHNGVSLQSGTSHYFGDGFSKAFDIKFSKKDNSLGYPYQTSWGISTRLIGAIIMSHGDDNGLILPPMVAPIQVGIVPIMMKKDIVVDACKDIEKRISNICRVKLDISDNSPGWKFSQYEMQGVPVRLEIGPKDLEKNQCVLVRRDNREKIFVSLDDIESKILEVLKDIQESLYNKASQNLEDRTYLADSWESFSNIVENNVGFIKSMWCGDIDCEDKVKNELGLSSRCIPFEQENISEFCICCGKKAECMVVWGKSY